MSLLHGQKPFLETNAWQKSHLNSLRYNTSQVGSALPLIFGTTRQQVNLIALGDYRGVSGKKGTNGPLPLTGTRNVGKGGTSSKFSGRGKKSGDYTVDVDFALCQGPVDILDKNKVWASAGTAFFNGIGLNKYTGEDGQDADPVFVGLGEPDNYSGTCHVTGTPLNLGPSPVLPNLSVEVTGFEVGTAGSGYPLDAGPANIIKRFLTDERWGAGWPLANLDPNFLASEGSNTYGDYCQAAQLAMSVSLQSQTEAASYISEVARLTNTAIVWSGTYLKFIPYGDLQLSNNGATWLPNLTPVYSFTDDDFLPWSPRIDSFDPPVGEEDPVVVTRSNPHDAANWTSIEYTDRFNHYNKTILPEFDQSAIDRYGLRTEPMIQGSCFCEATPAATSARLILQRQLFQRNTYRFQVGWQYSRLEPMDIVLLTDAKAGLHLQAARVTAIKENANGDLEVTADEIVTVEGDEVPPPSSKNVIYVNVLGSTLFGPLDGVVNGPKGMFSIDLYPEPSELHEDQVIAGIFRHYLITPFYEPMAFGVSYSYLDGSIAVRWGGQSRPNAVFANTDPDVIIVDGRWHQILLSWDMSSFDAQLVVDGKLVPLTINPYDPNTPFDVAYAVNDAGYPSYWEVFSGSNYVPNQARYYGAAQDLYFNTVDNLDLTVPANVKKFWNRGHAKKLGNHGELPTGSPPAIFLHYDGTSALSTWEINLGYGGNASHWFLPYDHFFGNPYGVVW